MKDFRDMEADAARYLALSPEERAAYDAKLHAHRVSLGLERSVAVEDVVAERARQVIEEGWTPEHDDEHSRGEISMAAATYAVSDKIRNDGRDPFLALLWPWDAKWWKPKERRRDLVRAGALIIAEIERLDRAQARRTDEGTAVISPREPEVNSK